MRIVFVLVTMLVLVTGCARLVRQPVHDVTAETENALYRKSGLQIAAFTTTDSTDHSFPGHVRYVGAADSLAFTRFRHSRPELILPADSVLTLSIKRSSPGATPALGLLIGTAIVILVLSGGPSVYGS